jgi:hypothetical protein
VTASIYAPGSVPRCTSTSICAAPLVKNQIISASLADIGATGAGDEGCGGEKLARPASLPVFSDPDG